MFKEDGLEMKVKGLSPAEEKLLRITLDLRRVAGGAESKL